MTTQPEAGSNEQTSANQITKPWRELIALVLVGANAVLLFVGLIDLLVPYSANVGFSSRAGGSFFDFAGIEAIVLPLLAVLLATHLKPPVPRAKLVTQVALAEYAVSAVFGVIALLAWLFGSLVDGEVRAAFTGLLVRIAYAGIFAAAAFLIYKVWRTLYYVPRPKPQPGMYGAPVGGPGGYPPAGPRPDGPRAGPPRTARVRRTRRIRPARLPAAAGLPRRVLPASAARRHRVASPPRLRVHRGSSPGRSRPGGPDAVRVVGRAGDLAAGARRGFAAGDPDDHRTPGLEPRRPPPAPAVQPDPPTAAIPTPEDERTQVINPASQQPSAGSVPPPAASGDEPTRPDIR